MPLIRVFVLGLIGVLIGVCQPALDSGTPNSNLSGVGNSATLAVGGTGAITNHLLVACVTVNYTSTYSQGSMSSTLTSSGNWHQASGVSLGAGGQDYVEEWYAISAGTGADTLTWTNVHSMGNIRLTVASYSGINTSSVVDQIATPGLQSTTSSFTTGSITVLLNTLLVGCGNKFNTAPTFTKGANYTSTVNSGAIANGILMQHQVAASAGSYASNYTTSSSTSGASTLIGFKFDNPASTSIHHKVVGP